MSKVFIEESTLTSIGSAIREKTGKSDLIAPLAMATEINGIVSGGGDLPEEAFVITGDCFCRFGYGGWDWFIENYGNRVTTKDINKANSMFFQSNASSIPFDLNFSSDNVSCSAMFQAADVEEIGAINNLKPLEMDDMFRSCNYLRYLPKINNLDNSYIQTSTKGAIDGMFYGCNSLREMPEEFLRELYNLSDSYNYTIFSSGFNGCHALDEIKELNPRTGTITNGSMFATTFKSCHRLKNVIFATQEDGTPYSVNWKSQTIDLTSEVGYCISKNNVLNYNSGITADKEVTDDATYQALKNDKDWFTTKAVYSRYNHNSAVNTINSLPDTSAYLATAGGTNTIKFRGAAGSATDGGAINTLTDAEIAVAAAKGWTVTLI